MKIGIDGETHTVIYIEYQNKLPFDVKTKHYIPGAVNGPYWRVYHWDFFANNGDQSDLRAYCSGSGGTPDEIVAPSFADGYTGQVWLAKDIKLEGTGKNFEIIKKPLRLKGWKDKTSINPFKVAEITNSSEYCERCGHDSTEFCYEHKYDDDDGTPRYKDDNSVAE